MSHKITLDNQTARFSRQSPFYFVVWLFLICFSTVASAQQLPDFTSLIEDNASAIVNVNTLRRSNRTAQDDDRMEELLDY